MCVCVCTHVWCVCVPLVEFRYLVFACMPGESCCWQLWSLLLYLRDIFQALLITLFVHVCACVCMRTHVCMCVRTWCTRNTMFTYYFSVFFGYMFVDPVKHPELTLADEIRCCRNDCYYYGSILLKRAHAS